MSASWVIYAYERERMLKSVGVAKKLRTYVFCVTMCAVCLQE